MTLERVPYQPITDRPWLIWPNSARVAVWVVPNVEHNEYLPPTTGGRDAWPRTPHPDVLGYGLRNFGNRVGLWWIAEVTDALEISLTLSLNLANWVHYPEASEARGWDVMAHGLYNTRYHWDMLKEAVHVLANEGGRTAVIGLHPWLFGIPHRIRYLDEGLRQISQTEGLWTTWVGEIVAHFRLMQQAEVTV